MVRKQKVASGWSDRHFNANWIGAYFGHLRDDNLKLIKVRCFNCAFTGR